MRRLLIAALVLAGLIAPPAVLAQIGSSPGITTPAAPAGWSITTGSFDADPIIDPGTGANPLLFAACQTPVGGTCMNAASYKFFRFDGTDNYGITMGYKGGSDWLAESILTANRADFTLTGVSSNTYDYFGIASGTHRVLMSSGSNNMKTDTTYQNHTTTFAFAGGLSGERTFNRLRILDSLTPIAGYNTRVEHTGGTITTTNTDSTKTSTRTHLVGSVQETIAGAATTTWSLSLSDSAANNVLQFTNVANPQKSVRLYQSSSTPSWTLQATDSGGGPSDGTVQVNSTSATMQASDGSASYSVTADLNGVWVTGLSNGSVADGDPGLWASMVSGGFTLDGTATSAVADEVDVTVVDTTPGITDGDVQVCGFVNSTAETAKLKTCETLDFSAGAATLTTTATFVRITNIKASSFAALGGGGDETVAAAWDADATSIVAAVNLTNSAKSDFTAGDVGPNAGAYNLIEMGCLDLQGCDVTLDDLSSGRRHELQIVLVPGTASVTFKDVDGRFELAGDADDTLNALDAIRFIYSVQASAWLQTALSEN